MLDNCVDRYFIVDIKMEILDISTLEKYDSQKMYKIYDKWPKIALEYYERDAKIIDFGKISHVVYHQYQYPLKSIDFHLQ